MPSNCASATEQLLIVAEGRVRPFDGDLDDYRDSLLKVKVKPEPPKPPAPPDRIGGRDPLVRGSNKKGAASRIKRIEETMARLNAKKTEIESLLAKPEVYQDGEKVKALMLDQAYVVRELERLESEWLELQC